ncbi:hypothetical protein [Nocardia africana]|uniref:Uncharacterized protein n=1 Tax=Nocardia africana TaxID=134964 RepID=A0ABW6NW90_9NOCA
MAFGIAGVGKQLGQLGETGWIVADPLLGYEFSLAVDDRDVMMPFGPIHAAVVTQSSPPSGVLRCSMSLAETRSALLTSLDGLASDELFAIPAHPHGTGLSQSSRAREIAGRLVVREGSNHELSQSNTTAGQERHTASKPCPADSTATSPAVLHKGSGPRDLQE